MPAGNVSVEAVFEETIYADRAPVGSNIQAVAVNEGQTAKELLGNGFKTYTEVTTPGDIAVDGALKSALKKNLYVVFDLKLAAAAGEDPAEALTIALNGTTNGGILGPQLIFATGETAGFAVKTAGQEYNVTLNADQWYKVVISTESSSSATSNIALAAYPIDNTDAVSTTAAVTGSDIGGRNVANKQLSQIQYRAITGTPQIDNYYMYEESKYDATVTVTDGTNPLAGVTVTLNDKNALSATTNDEGVASFSVQAGSYTATVAKSGYIAPETAPTLTVAKDGANTASAAMTAKVKTTLTVTAPASAEVTAGDATGITYTAVVKDQNDDVMTADEAPVTWTVLNAAGDTEINDGTINVTNGKITATDGATAGTYTIKASAGGSTTDYTSTFTVKVASPATVTLTYVDTDNNAIGKADETITGVFVGNALTIDPTSDDYKAYFAEYGVANSGADEGTTTYYNYDAEATTSDVLTIAELAATQTITIKYSTDGKKYYQKETFDTLTAGSEWGTAESNAHGYIVSGSSWPTAKYKSYAPGNNSADKLTNGNQALLLLTHDAIDGSVTSPTLPGSGDKAISFKWAKNDSKSGRTQHLVFYDNADNEVIRFRMGLTSSSGTYTFIYYSVDGGTNWTVLDNTDDTDWHSIILDFDMANKTYTLTFDGTLKTETAAAFNTAATGSTVSYFKMIDGYSITSSLIDDLYVIK